MKIEVPLSAHPPFSSSRYLIQLPITIINNENGLVLHMESLDKNHEHDARFFDNIEDTLRTYSCFSLIETGDDAHG